MVGAPVEEAESLLQRKTSQDHDLSPLSQPKDIKSDPETCPFSRKETPFFGFFSFEDEALIRPSNAPKMAVLLPCLRSKKYPFNDGDLTICRDSLASA